MVPHPSMSTIYAFYKFLNNSFQVCHIQSFGQLFNSKSKTCHTRQNETWVILPTYTLNRFTTHCNIPHYIKHNLIKLLHNVVLSSSNLIHKWDWIKYTGVTNLITSGKSTPTWCITRSDVLFFLN